MTLNLHLTDEGRENWLTQGARGSLDLNSSFSTTDLCLKACAALPCIAPESGHECQLSFMLWAFPGKKSRVRGDVAGNKRAGPGIEVSRDTDIREGLLNSR
jgi:hypothetical protein